MAYIGKTPSQATRSRFYYTATGGETSLSGADDNGNTLVFSDGNYVDVMLNGVNLVAGTDYNTTTANTIGGLTALTADDVVEIVVYDTFSVFGGDVKGNFNVQNGTLTAQQGLVVDNDGATVATFDRATSDGAIVDLQKDGTTVGTIGVYDTGAGLDVYMADTVCGLRMSQAGTDNILPCNADGSNSDNDIDLGSSSTRFKDLYLSGGVYLGGTTAVNYLDDYEEGDFQPSFESTGASFTYDSNFRHGEYVKVGRNVFFSIYISTGSAPTGTTSSGLRITGLPFANANDSNGNHTAVSISQLWNFDWPSSAKSITASVSRNNAYMNIREERDSATSQSILASNLLAGCYIIVSGSYIASA